MLDNKIIVVTGGAGLLGRAFCKAISDNGGVAIVADVQKENAENIAESLCRNGGKAEAVTLDITSTQSIDDLIRYLHGSYQRIDAVVNNAYPRNHNYGRMVEDVSYEDFCENTNLHLGGYFLVSQRFALYFRNYGGGNIVNLSSIYGSMVPRFEVYADTPRMTMPVEYAAIKSAINHLSRYFAAYFKKDCIRCNTLSPSGILDNQDEAFLQQYNNHCAGKGMLDPVDITGSLVYLLSDASSHVTGQDLVVDDGYCL